MAASGIVAGCVAGLIPAIRVLVSGEAVVIRAAWSVPYGSFYVVVDPLSGFFLVPILALGALAAVYGVGYLAVGHEHHSPGAYWFFYALLTGGMALVVVAHNAVLFLMAWEVMSLASFFLVTLDSEKESARSAGWTYLVATHLGTAFLLAMFLLLGRGTGLLDFDRFGVTGPAGEETAAIGSATASTATPALSTPTATTSVGTSLASASTIVGVGASVLFLLGLVGFGTKAGLMPFHVWLPEAHPAAPSPVSALMSGAMIKTGIYGLVRVLTWLGPPPAWWGGLLVALGLVSGVLGVVFALAQHDLKRLLAYHSVENIGIIVMGLGVGLLGRALGSPALTALGFAGALLHVVNHAVFKGLLFLGAGSAMRSAGTGDLDRLGGLLKRMPWTGATFLVAAAAISGLPPLNGFVSEYLIYLSAYRGTLVVGFPRVVGFLGIVAGLALIGGLAAACFAKAFGIVFLGEPRTRDAAEACECGLAMRVPMLILAAACFGIGLAAPWIPFVFRHIVPSLAGSLAPGAEAALVAARSPLSHVAVGSWLLILGAAFLLLLRRSLLSGRVVEKTGTWDCGYARPTARMQYTASSFAQPITRMFQGILRTRVEVTAPVDLFPREGRFHSHTGDVFREKLFAPLFAGVARAIAGSRRLQEGRVQIYILYMAVTLVILLLWKL